MLGGFTPRRATALHAKLKKIRKPSQAKQADQHDVKEFNEALAEAKGAHPNREQVQTVTEVPASITNEGLLLRAKKLMDILVALNIEDAFDAV